MKIFSDISPYQLKEEKSVNYPTKWSTHSIERRNLSDQESDKFIVVGLNQSRPQGNILMKLCFNDDLSCKDQVILSKHDQDDLYRCHTVQSDLILAFHKHYLAFYNENLECRSQMKWSEQLSIEVQRLSK